ISELFAQSSRLKKQLDQTRFELDRCVIAGEKAAAAMRPLYEIAAETVDPLHDLIHKTMRQAFVDCVTYYGESLSSDGPLVGDSSSSSASSALEFFEKLAAFQVLWKAELQATLQKECAREASERKRLALTKKRSVSEPGIRPLLAAQVEEEEEEEKEEKEEKEKEKAANVHSASSTALPTIIDDDDIFNGSLIIPGRTPSIQDLLRFD
ncbi:MAG: hypothetical protein Q8P67_07905, partial [archaeon]|nr:hypothetical protein [archaeon]